MRFILDTLAIFWHAMFPKASKEPWTVVLETGVSKTFDTGDEAQRFADHRRMYSKEKLLSNVNYSSRVITLSAGSHQTPPATG